MDGGSGKIEAGSEPGAPVPPPTIRRPAHRPRGTNYRRIDRPLHEEMRRMIEQGKVPSLTAAAMALSHLAYPPTSRLESKAKRLVATYPWPDG